MPSSARELENVSLKVEEYKNLEQLLEDYRESRNISKTEMSRLLGVPLNFYTDILNRNRHLSLKKAKEWAHILGADPTALRVMVLRERLTRNLEVDLQAVEEHELILSEVVREFEQEHRHGSSWDTNEFLHLDQNLVSFFSSVPNKQELEKVANEILRDVLIEKRPILHSKILFDELKDLDPLTPRQRVEIQNILQNTVTDVVDAIAESLVKVAKSSQSAD